MPSIYRTRRRSGSPPRASRVAQEHQGTRAERQAARRQVVRRRRERVLLAGSVVLSAVVVAAWFPFSALYHQHQQLASTSAHLAQVRSEDAALQREEHRLGSSSEVARIAREQYQLEQPGRDAYEVLPPSSAAGGTYEGDPGLQGPVRPSAASELPPGADGSAPTAGKHGGSTASAGGRAATGKGRAATPTSPSGGSTSLLGRITQTLEFWR